MVAVYLLRHRVGDISEPVRRLSAAAADSKTRHNMNVENEYFSVIEKRDTVIMMRDKELEKKSVQLGEQKKMLRASVRVLSELGKSFDEISASLGIDVATAKLLVEKTSSIKHR